MIWVRVGALAIFCAISVFAGWWAVTPNLMFCALALLVFSGPYDLMKRQEVPEQTQPAPQLFGAPLRTGGKWSKHVDVLARWWLIVGGIGVIFFLLVVKTNRTERLYESGLAILLGALVSLAQWRVAKRTTAPNAAT